MTEKEDKRTRWLHLRLTPAEYDRLDREYRQTTCRKLSQFARRKLLGNSITIRYRNQSLDEFMHEMIGLRNELNRLGSNFNQAVKKLHSLHQIPEFHGWLLSWDTERDMLLRQVEAIKHKLNSIADQWLP